MMKYGHRGDPKWTRFLLTDMERPAVCRQATRQKKAPLAPNLYQWTHSGKPCIWMLYPFTANTSDLLHDCTTSPYEKLSVRSQMTGTLLFQNIWSIKMVNVFLCFTCAKVRRRLIKCILEYDYLYSKQWNTSFKCVLFVGQIWRKPSHDLMSVMCSKWGAVGFVVSALWKQLHASQRL